MIGLFSPGKKVPSMNSEHMHPACEAAVVIPCLNEENSILSVASQLAAEISTEELSKIVEIFFVDNGSSDGTYDVLSKFITKKPFMHLVQEKERGIGFARKKGVQTALLRSIKRASSHSEHFWLLSTDADTVLPAKWISNWLEVISETPYLIIAGCNQFPNTIKNSYPNSYQILSEVQRFVAKMEIAFGVTNCDGNNFAIERLAYATIGPFDQPQRHVGDRKINMPGEDWDMGTKARALGLPIGKDDRNIVTVSARRMERNPYDFFSGNAYEQEFLRVNSPLEVNDVRNQDLETMLQTAIRRHCIHYVEKPIIMDQTLLASNSVQQLIGLPQTEAIKHWLTTHPLPDIFLDRAAFFDHLEDFDHTFGNNLFTSIWNKYVTRS